MTDRPVWDQETETYEDFLERLPPDLQEGLAEGTAYMARPEDGFDLMSRFMDSAGQQNELAEFIAFVDAVETEEEAKQLISDIASLEIVAESIAKALMRRKDDIHKLTCERCRAAGKASKGNVKRALDAARQAFMDALRGGDPEAWKGEDE